MNLNKFNYFLGTLLIMVLTFTSCDEVEDPNVGGTNVEVMAGDWYLEGFIGDTQIAGFTHWSTYNTAADDGTEMWLDDFQTFWWMKAKVPVNLNSLTFEGSDLASSVNGYDITVTVTNGQIVLDGAETSGGNVSHAMSFDVEFSDDPGTIYTLRGYKRTGFPEDEH